jgi:hypothetical protein
MPTFEEIEAKIIENRILANRQANVTPTTQPTIPDTFATTPQPSTTAVMPITQRKVGTLEPEEPTGVMAILRNAARGIGRWVDPETISLGGKEVLDRITSEGYTALPSIAKQIGAPLAEVFKVWVYGHMPEGIKSPEVKRREKEAWRNIGLDPTAAPGTFAMAVGGGAGLARLAGKVTTGAKVAVGVSKLKPMATGEPVVATKPKVSPKPSVKPTVKTRVVKEPWEMTKKEFYPLPDKSAAVISKEGKIYTGQTHPEAYAKLEKAGDTLTEFPKSGYVIKGKFFEDRVGAGDFHKQVIKQALSENKPVPAEVLKDYPDIAKPTVSKKTVGKLTAEQDAGIAALDDISADLFKQKETALPTKQKAIDAEIRRIGQQKQALLVGEAGRVYVPVEEVRAATNRALKALDLKTAPETKAVRDLNAVRRGDIAEADVRVGFAKKEIHRVVTDPKRREAITHAIEDPKLASGLSEIEKGVRNEVKRFYDEGFKVANDADVITSAVENYINHVWETKSPKRTMFSGKYISGKTPFAKQRKIPSIVEGERMGLKAKTKDPGELMEIWSRSVHRAIANKRFLDNLKIAQAEDGRLLIQPGGSAPSDYVSYDHPSLRQYRWRGKEGKGAIFQTGVRVHPDIAGSIDVAFGQGWMPRGKWGQRVFNGYTALDRAAKKSILTVSLFHYHALSESAIATGQSPWAFVRGTAKLVGNEELIVRAKRSGLQLAGTPDVARQSLRFEKVPTFVGKGLRATVGKIIEKNDKILWDNVHAGHKIEAFDRLTRDALTNKKYSHLKPAEIDRVVSTFVNDAFGGLDWEALGTSTKGQWVWQRSLLAPDWTRSQVRVFKGMFRAGKRGTTERLSGELYRAYWRRAITYNYGGANALNYVFTAWKAGDPTKGHFMPQNASGHRFQLEMPYEGDDGKPRWIQVGKQFMEPFRYVEDILEGKPLRTLSGKVNPIPRMIVSSIFNRRYPGGPSIYKEKDSPGLKYLKQIGYVAESVTPIPAQQYIGVFKGWKDPMDAFISGLGFPVKKDFQKKKGLRP